MMLLESELLLLLLVETMVARPLSPSPFPGRDASLGCWGAASRKTNLGRVINSSSLGWRRSRGVCPAAISFLGTWSADKLARRDRRGHQRPQDRRRGSSLGENKSRAWSRLRALSGHALPSDAASERAETSSRAARSFKGGFGEENGVAAGELLPTTC